MSGAQPPQVDADWWPSALSQTDFEDMFAGEELQLGRMEFGSSRYHLSIVGVLLGDDDLATARAITGRFDHIFRVAEPDWSSGDDGEPFEPRAGFYLPDIGKVEALVTVISRSQ